MRVFQKPHIARRKDEQSLGQSVFVRIFFCSPYVVPVNGGPLSLGPSVGNLSNNDDDAYENVTWKVNSRWFKLYRAYSISFNSSYVGDFFWSWILKDCIEFLIAQKAYCSRDIYFQFNKVHYAQSCRDSFIKKDKKKKNIFLMYSPCLNFYHNIFIMISRVVEKRIMQFWLFKNKSSSILVWNV